MPFNKLIQWLTKNSFKVEIALVFLVVLTVWMNASKISGGEKLLSIFISLLAGFYFLSAFYPLELKEKFSLIAYKVFSIASSICVVGFNYTILHLPGAEQMLFIGTTALGASGLVILFYNFGSGNNKFLPLLLRMAFLGIISVTTLMKLL